MGDDGWEPLAQESEPDALLRHLRWHHGCVLTAGSSRSVLERQHAFYHENPSLDPAQARRLIAKAIRFSQS